MADELLIKVRIDPLLDLAVEVPLQRGTPVSELAEILAGQDPTGATVAADIGFRLPDAAYTLPDDVRLEEKHMALDLCHPRSQERAQTLSPEALLECRQASPCEVVREPVQNLSQKQTTELEKEAATEIACATTPIEESGGKRESQAHRRVLYAISDTHCEAKPNMSWLEELPAHPDDTIILAGDVGVEIGQIESALRLFLAKYKHVFYCFGNHECWISRHKFADSFAKIEAIRALCKDLGVRTTAALVDGNWIVPIIGWYHATWDTEPPLTAPPGVKLKVNPREPSRMSNDYMYCRWGDVEHGSEALAERIDAENEAWGGWPLPDELLAEAQLPPGQRTHPIVTFSHFLPRMELFVEKRMSMEPNLSKLIGSNWTRKRVDQLRPDIHVFGHTHMCWDMHLDGVRYLSWPLGMPEERFWRRAAFPNSDCSVPLKILDSNGVGPRSEDACFASRMYSLIERDPSSHVMAHRVASKFCPEAPVLFDDICMPGRVYSWALPEDPELRKCVAEAARKVKELKRKGPTVYPQWRVVGGEDRGGILVRETASLESAKYPERLSTGALVEELARSGDRLMYRLLAGTGPETGWVATILPEQMRFGQCVPEKELLLPEAMPPKSGDLKLEKVLRLQEALIGRLSDPEVQRSLKALLKQHGRQRHKAAFAQRRKAILQAEFDKVLPSFGFPKGNLMQLDPAIMDFYDVNTGDDRVKRNKRTLDQLMLLHYTAGDNSEFLMGG